MKSFLLIPLFLLAACAQPDCSRVETFVREDPLRSASNLHRYEVLDSSVTEAPRGYVPFYVSHISRHGSRSAVDDSFSAVLDSLGKYDSCSQLTAEAQEMFATLLAIKSLNDSVEPGALTSLGASEHRNIARRMCGNYPEVFSDSARRFVLCYSTSVPRVVKSMDNFTESLSSSFPGLVVCKAFGKESDRNHDEIGGFDLSKAQKKLHSGFDIAPLRDSLMDAWDLSRLIEKTFVGGKVPASLEGDEGQFFHNIYKAGAIRQCFEDSSTPWIEPYFNGDELYLFWQRWNIKHLFKWGWVEENHGIYAYSKSPVLKSIIRDADTAVAGSDTCATFRFTHDSVLQPLICLMGLDWNDWHGSLREVCDHCCMAHTTHMASNVQLIFFRNRKGNVIVKILLNEEEITIPALKPDFKGVFYEWTRLREYFNDSIDELENNINNLS